MADLSLDGDFMMDMDKFFTPQDGKERVHADVNMNEVQPVDELALLLN